jgi:outer membrane protein
MFERIGLRPLVVCSALLVFAHLAAAQSKVAVINLQRAVFDSAEIKKADAEMQARFKPQADRATQLQNEIAAISQKLQAGGANLTPQAEAELNAEGTRKQRELTRLNEDLQGAVEQQRNDILTKSSEKMRVVVKKIAEAKGIDMVVDVATTLYFKPAMDITDEAIAEYNKTYPVAGAPAASK